MGARRWRRGRALLVAALVATATGGLLTVGSDAGQATTTTGSTTTGSTTTGSLTTGSTTTGSMTTGSTTTTTPVPPVASPPNLTLTFEDGGTGGLRAAPGVTLQNSTQTPYSGARHLRIDGPSGYGELARLPLGDLDPHRDWRLQYVLRGDPAVVRDAVVWDVVVGGRLSYRIPGWLRSGWTSGAATIPAWSVPSGPAELVLSTYRCPTAGLPAPSPLLLDDLQLRQADSASPQPSTPPAAPAEPDCPRSTADLDQVAPGSTVRSWDFEDGSTQGWAIGDPARVGATVANTGAHAASGSHALLVRGLRVADQERGPGLARQPTGRLPVGAYRLTARVLAISGGGSYPGVEGVVATPGTRNTVSTGWSTAITPQAWTTVAVPFRFEDNALWSAALQVWNRGFCLPGGTAPMTFAVDDVRLVYLGAADDGRPPAGLPPAPLCSAFPTTTTSRTSSS